MLDLKKKFNLKTNIILMLLLWVFVFSSILYFNSYINNQFEKHILDSIESLLIENSINMNNEIKNKFNVLTVIADNLSEEDLSNPKEKVKEFSAIVEKNGFKKLAITTLDGTAYVHSGEIINVADRDYFQNSINGENFISNIVSSKIDSRKSNVYSVPIYKNDEIVGVLWASMLSDNFYKNLDLYTINEFGNTFIIDEYGNLIVSEVDFDYDSDNFNFFDKISFEDKKNFNNLQIMKNDFKNLKNNYIELSFNGSNSHIYYVKLDYNNWWCITTISDKLIYNSYGNTIRTTAIISIIIILLLSILFFVILRKEKRNFKSLENIAYIDTITNGNNDAFFLKKNISNLISKKDNWAFLSLEIINIKNIVTIVGLKNAEFLLKEIYTYLYDILNEDEIIVHSYFGEHKLLMKYSNIKEFTKRLEDINFSKINENIKFKIGVYLVKDYDISYEEMCSYVSIAKEVLNNNKYMIYNKKMHKREIDKIRLEEDIKNGIKNKEFKAWFQPKYGRDGKSIIGAEALVRWHKYGSIIYPNIFIPVCEANGLIKEIDEIIFEDVCKNIREWTSKNKNVKPIYINLSRSYLDKVNLIERLEKYINKYNIPKELINFEITESSLIGNEEKLKDTISILHEKGYKVSVDDFGVGYSSIKAISYVNFDTLKIDKSFVDGIGQEKWENIIKYTINLANSLGMSVVAEGIETEEQYKFLLECGCDMFQGYYFNKPMSPDNFSKLI